MSEISELNSKSISHCQICNSTQLTPKIFLGYIPSVNSMPEIKAKPTAELRFPLELLSCEECSLVQIGYDVDQRILFPETYPYLSGTTRILRDNFAELAEQTSMLFDLTSNDLVVDIGANDGTLLAPFKAKGYKVLGIEPSQAADVAVKNGITMMKTYFNQSSADQVVNQYGKAKIITAANVFAHITQVHDVVSAIKTMMLDDGVFISENHYLLSLIQTLQYDTIYHEHLRYYSLTSLLQLFKRHDLDIIRIKKIPTHGGSIRVYTARPGIYQIDDSVKAQLALEEKAGINTGRALDDFKEKVEKTKIDLLKLICQLKQDNKRIVGVGAPSRSSTLINYTGLDETLVDCVLELSNSHKLNKFVPGTRVPVLDEALLYREQPDFAILYSWHIADELIPNLKKRGYKGKFIVPLPSPRIVD